MLHLLGAHARVDGGGTYALRAQAVYLVLHEGDERRDDERQTREHQPWHLEGNTLTAARRHQPKGVTPCQHGLHDLLLQGAEVLVAPIALQYLDARELAVGYAWAGVMS